MREERMGSDKQGPNLQMMRLSCNKNAHGTQRSSRRAEGGGLGGLLRWLVIGVGLLHRVVWIGRVGIERRGAGLNRVRWGGVRCGRVEWHGMVWYGMLWYDTVWYGMVWYGMVSYGMVCYAMVSYCIVSYRMVSYGMGWGGAV